MMSDESPTVVTERQKTSNDVSTTIDHLRNNRTTETEARSLRDAAVRSLSDHALAKSIGRRA